MDKSAADSYVYAKTSGMLKKTFAGDGAVALFGVDHLHDLWPLIFGADTPCPQLPGSLLANRIEYNAVKKFVKQYIHLLEAYDKPNPFLIELLRRYEITNLKVLAAANTEHEAKRPRIINIAQYKLLNYDAWPNLDAVIKGSVFDWYHDATSILERQTLDYHLDLQEIKTLWSLLDTVRDEGQQVLRDYFITSYSMRNMVWALRLKVFYDASDEFVRDNLFYVGDEAHEADPICRWAFDALKRDIHNKSDWESWRFAAYLNETNDSLDSSSHKIQNGRVRRGVDDSLTSGEADALGWTIDPVLIEENLRYIEAQKVRKLFHKYPASTVTLAMFYKIKQQELDCIRAATEKIRLHTDMTTAMHLAGVN